MTRPGFSFCVCPDPAIIREHIDAELEDYGGPIWQRRVFWADEDLPPAFWDSLTLSGLMDESRALILRRAESSRAEFWDQLLPVLGRFNPKVWPFFCLEGDWTRGKPKIPAELTRRKFWEMAEKRHWVWTAPGLTRTSLKAHIVQWATDKGLTFASGVLETATQILPLDLTGLRNELAKLALLLDRGRTITASDLGVVSFQADLDIFAFLATLQARDGALTVWRKVLAGQAGASSDMVFPFLGLVVREARILWQLAQGEDEAVRLPPFVKKDKTTLARWIGPGRLARIWTLALETEVGIKSGQRSPDQAMEAFVSGLMLLFQRPA